MSGVDEISQLSGKPVACVPCSMTPVESASRPMLPSAFPDGVGLHHFLYGAQSHGPQRSLSTLRPWGRPQLRKTRFQLYLRPWLGGIGYPQGFNSRFQLMASSSARLGWRTREAGRRLTIGLISQLPARCSCDWASHPTGTRQGSCCPTRLRSNGLLAMGARVRNRAYTCEEISRVISRGQSRGGAP